MATALKKPVRREVTIADIFGRRGPVELTLTGTGIWMRGKGTTRKLFVSFDRLRPDSLPGNMPAAYAQNPLGWLIR